MPFCNETDRGSNFAPLERGPTSYVKRNASAGVTLREDFENFNSRHVYNGQYITASGYWPTGKSL